MAGAQQLHCIPPPCLEKAKAFLEGGREKKEREKGKKETWKRGREEVGKDGGSGNFLHINHSDGHIL